MTQSSQDTQFSLADIAETIKRYKKLILITPGICGAFSYIFVTFFVLPTWEVSVVLQVGQVGQIGLVSQTGLVSQAPKLVEPIPNVISRMIQPSFAHSMLEQSSFKTEDIKTLENIYKSSIKVLKVKDADLIEFKVRGYSAQMAQLLATETINYLQNLHGEMMEAGITRIASQIQATNEDLLTVKAEVQFLKEQLQSNRNWNSYNATLAATVLQDKSTQLRALTQSKFLLTEQLSPSITFPTKIIGELTVSDDPVSPKKLLTITLAVLLGLIGGILAAFLHSNFRKENT